MKKCDIIIPIYNAYDCLSPCIDSVIKNTEFNGNKLILINDKSTDKRVDKLLKKYEKNNKDIVLLENEENLGFVKTVNKGMKYSNNDVLLLNSDTEVTKNWLKKITKCAYSSDDVATVTPLSNNATLASVPVPYVPNDIPEGYTLDSMAELVEKCSLHAYPEIPTGHGFCLFIKREALDKVGYFDEINFGKGYGEENDFSFRCFEYGYRHLLCDDTYILHKESKSFLDSKVERIKNALEKLENLHPIYMKKMNFWNSQKPLKYIGDNVNFALSNDEERPNILYVIHDFNKQRLGGTTLHAYDLIEKVRKKMNVHVLSVENSNIKVSSYFKNTEFEIAYPLHLHDINITNGRNNEYKRVVKEIVNNYRISFVHIHHLLNHYFDLFDVLLEENIPYMITLHDFYTVCPLINKLNYDMKYCGMNPTISQCNECLKLKYKDPIDIESWRKKWRYYLKNAKEVVVPSEATKEEIMKIYDDIDFTVIEHGVEFEKTKKSYSLGKTKNIAWIGAVGIHKGSKILEKMTAMNKSKDYKIHLFGIMGNAIFYSNKNNIDHGSYKREELKDLLIDNKIDLVCLFSIGPETYSYTMTEAVSCGIPVISFDLGAVSERIKKYGLGWVVDNNLDPKSIYNEIKSILNDEEEYNRVLKNVEKYKIKSIDEMVASYMPIYTKYANKNDKVDNKLFDKMLNNNFNNISFVYNDNAWVFKTLKWKIISKFKAPKSLKKYFRKFNG